MPCTIKNRRYNARSLPPPAAAHPVSTRAAPGAAPRAAQRSGAREATRAGPGRDTARARQGSTLPIFQRGDTIFRASARCRVDRNCREIMTAQNHRDTRNLLKLIGWLAVGGVSIGVVADLFSGWSTNPNSMTIAVSLGLDNIKGLKAYPFCSGSPRYGLRRRLEVTRGEKIAVVSDARALCSTDFPVGMAGFDTDHAGAGRGDAGLLWRQTC